MNRIILLLTMLSVSVYAADNDQAERNLALLDAALHGNTDNVRNLLSLGADIRACGTCYRTALHKAATYGYIDIVRELVGCCSREEINAKDAFGDTPLHEAAKSGHSEIATFLLESGADTGAKNKGGKTPTDLAQEYGRNDIVQLIRDHENPDIKEPGCD